MYSVNRRRDRLASVARTSFRLGKDGFKLLKFSGGEAAKVMLVRHRRFILDGHLVTALQRQDDRQE